MTVSDKLGRGSFGVVNKGTLNGLPVCIKVCELSGSCEQADFVFYPQSMHALNSPELYRLAPGSVEEKAVLDELIGEVTMLAGLHSDKNVSFRGVCVWTLPQAGLNSSCWSLRQGAWSGICARYMIYCPLLSLPTSARTS
jgi:hypothetical protein